MSEVRPPFYVLTGGPGSGKSTLIAALAARGFRTVAEAGRAVIREEQARGGNALPWADRAAFARAMFDRDLAERRSTPRNGPAFFDRGLPDVAGYMRLSGLSVPEDMDRAIATLPYAAPVFLAPYWDAIFAQDAERRQDREEARRTAEMMADVYAALGYEIVLLPLAPQEERADFVLRRIGLNARV